MTQPIDFVMNTYDGQRTITITPVNLALTSGMLYSTGEYSLAEGAVGLGTVFINGSGSYNYDGFGDISNAEIAMIVSFIRRHDPLLSVRRAEPVKTAAASPLHAPKAAPTINFIAQSGGKPVDVHVALTFPVYEVSVSGRLVAKLQQDHHSNWFVASGVLDDNLTQEIGKRIERKVANG